MWKLLMILATALPAVHGQCDYCFGTYAGALLSMRPSQTDGKFDCAGLQNFLLCVEPCHDLKSEATHVTAKLAVTCYCHGDVFRPNTSCWRMEGDNLQPTSSSGVTPSTGSVTSPPVPLTESELIILISNIFQQTGLRETVSSEAARSLVQRVLGCPALISCLSSSYQRTDSLPDGIDLDFMCRYGKAPMSCFESFSVSCSVTSLIITNQIEAVNTACSVSNGGAAANALISTLGLEESDTNKIEGCQQTRQCTLGLSNDALTSGAEQICRIQIPVYTCFLNAADACALSENAKTTLTQLVQGLTASSSCGNALPGNFTIFNSFLDQQGCSMLGCFSLFYGIDSAATSDVYCRAAGEFLTCADQAEPLSDCNVPTDLRASLDIIDSQMNNIRNQIQTRCPTSSAVNVVGSPSSIFLIGFFVSFLSL